MKKKIDLDIITNYFCNYSCDYCFLNKLRNDKNIINLDKLTLQLEHISEKYKIKNINLYGGEISLLPLNFSKKIIDLCKKYSKVNVITNFSNQEYNDFLNKENVSITTSVNEERDNNEQTEYNILLSDIKDLSLIQVATPSLIKRAPKDILEHLELFKKDVGFLPYSPAQFAKTCYDISNKDFSIFMKNILNEYLNGNYSFRIFNIEKLNEVFSGEYDPTMQSILFINPLNEYSSIAYKDNKEYFKTFDSLELWENECQKEAMAYKQACSDCKYYKRCYAEHIKEWRSDDECCGMKSLLEWYEKNIY